MPAYISRRSFVPLAVVTAFVIACGGKDAAQEEQARQVELQPPPSPAVAPPLNDAPAGKAGAVAPAAKSPAKPATTTPVSAAKPASGGVAPAAAPAVKFGLIASGTQISLHAATRVCTNTQKAGDHIDATVTDAVKGTDGAAIPAGAVASLEVIESQYGQNDADKVKLSLRVASLTIDGQTYDVTGADVVAPPLTKVRRQSTGDQVGKVAVGTAAGAVVGRVIGKDTRSTVIGGAVGAATGAVVAKKTADYDGCIAADAKLVATLTRDVRVRVGA